MLYKMFPKFGIKEIESDKRLIRGWLSRIEPDEIGDISHPEGFEKHIPMFMKNPVLFFGHEWWSMPIGKWLSLKPVLNEGLWTEAQLAEGTATADEAWLLIQQDMLKALSYGYDIPDGGYYIDDQGYRHLTDTKILEGSIVPLGMNRLALFETAKSKGLHIISLNKAPENAGAESKENVSMNKEEILALIKGSTNDLEAQVKTLGEQIKTIEQARSTIAGIQETVKSCVTDADLKAVQAKTEAALLAATNKLQQDLEQKWAMPPAMGYDVGSIEQAKRLGFTKALFRPGEDPIPIEFKSALIIKDKAEIAAARFGFKDRTHLVTELQKANDMLFVVGAVLGMVKSDNQGGVTWGNGFQNLKSYKIYMTLMNEFVTALGGKKALDTLTAGEGYEWLPGGMSAELQMGIEMERGLIKRIPRFPMPANPFKWPLLTSTAAAYRRSEATTDANAVTVLLSQYASGNITFDATGIASGMLASYEIVEDSIIAIMDTILADIKRAIINAEENAAINGDVSDTHQDTDVSSTTDVRTMLSGLRYQGLNVSNASKNCAGSITYDLLVDILNCAGDYALMTNPGAELGFFGVPRVVYFKLLKLTEFKTQDVFGQMAANATGKLLNVLGHDIVPSVYCRQDLNTSGVNGSSGNNYSAVLYVNPLGFKIGDRRMLTVEQEKIILTGQNVVVATERIDMKKMVPAAHTPVSIGYNIAN